MKVLWPHNFAPTNAASGNFMHLMKRGMEDIGVEIHLEYLGNLRGITKILRERQRISDLSKSFDIVHSQFGSACAVVSSKCVTPSILSLRGSDWHTYLGKNIALSAHNIFASLMSKISIRSFDLVIVMSNIMSKEVIAAYPDSRVEVMPDAIDLNKFRLSNVAELRKELGEAENKNPWVLFTTVSINNPIKRASLAIEAIKYAKKEIPNIELRVASGISPSDMPKFVGACDLVLCTSTHEGWPNSVKEALACGIPFVSTDVSDLKQIVKEYPACRVSDPVAAELGKNIVEALRLRSARMVPPSIMEMNMESTCRRLLAIYENVLNENRSACAMKTFI